jgi:hypothetical protein
MEEEGISWYDKVSDAMNEATENVRGAINDVFDRISGKESSVSIDLEDVGLNLGEDKRYTATGSIKVSLTTLK